MIRCRWLQSGLRSTVTQSVWPGGTLLSSVIASRTAVGIRCMLHLCPRCSSDEIERVRPHGIIDHLERLLRWHVYRCRECDHRFYDLRS
jgi:hypothetical protein